jgi:hypothetical protein
VAAFPTYQIGTVSVSNGSTAVTGTSMLWTAANACSGDAISINGLPFVRISDVTDFTYLTLMLPWDSGDLTGVPYIISQESKLRVSGVDGRMGVASLLAKLESMNIMWFLDEAWSEPSVAKPPIVAAENQSILKISTGQLWVMQDGAWVAAGTFKGFNFTGEWSSATAYNASDVVTDDGSGYIAIAPSTNQAPPNPTYWALLASKGDTGAAATITVGTVTTGAPGTDATVTNVGTSGAAVFDFTIPRGDTGTVADALLIANNLSDVANAAAARANIGAGTVNSVATAGLATGGPITGSGTVTVTAATQADQETATSNAVAVTPGRQQFHPSAAKAWCSMGNAGTPTIQQAYNVTSLTDNGVGDTTFNFTTAMSSNTYAAVAIQQSTVPFTVAAATRSIDLISKSTAGVRFATGFWGASSGYLDMPVNVVVYGDI